MEQIVLFDYMGLDTETRIIVQQEDKEFDQNMESAGRSFVFACRNLQRIHKTLLYTRPGFVEYIAAKPGMSKSTAYRMIDVAKMFPNLGNISAAPSALYLLAAPSTPEPARIEAIERAEAGEVITHKTAKGIVTEYQRKESQDAKDERLFVEEYFGETDDAARPSCVTVIDEWGSEETIRIEPDEEIGVVKTPHVARNSGNNEWYTPEPFIIAARAVMGGIDCDPATSEEANTTVGASTIYTAETDGLSHNWRGRVWLNPPYAAPLISQFCEKLSLEFQSGRVTEGIVLVNNATETGWFATLIDCASAIVFPQTRVRFWQPSGEIGAPLQGQAILYFGGKPKTFLSEFKTFGWGAYL
jgi:phage N-6-adenine-methyltransferase